MCSNEVVQFLKKISNVFTGAPAMNILRTEGGTMGKTFSHLIDRQVFSFYMQPSFLLA